MSEQHLAVIENDARKEQKRRKHFSDREGISKT